MKYQLINRYLKNLSFEHENQIMDCGKMDWSAVGNWLINSRKINWLISKRSFEKCRLIIPEKLINWFCREVSSLILWRAMDLFLNIDLSLPKNCWSILKTSVKRYYHLKKSICSFQESRLILSKNQLINSGKIDSWKSES